MRKIFLSLIFLLSSISLQANEGTVIGIHGLMATSQSLNNIRHALRCACFDICLWEYNSREATICAHADRLVHNLQCIATLKPGEPIHFVTHSIGALILRCALSHPCCPEEAKIGRAVLLAPPNRGSKLARMMRDVLIIRWALGDQSGQELMTYEACDIQCLGTFPPSMSILVIAGKQGTHLWFNDHLNDGFLEVEETLLETPYYLSVLPLTHGKLLTNGRSLKTIRDFLLCGCVDE